MNAFKINVGVDKISSEEYLSDLIDRYQDLIFSICYKLTKDYFAAEDLTQETFLSAFKHPESFQGGNEKAWICRIATNKSIDYLRQAGRRVIPAEDVTVEAKLDNVKTPETVYLEKEVRGQLLNECRQLKPPYDEIATMYFYEEKKAEEIAMVKGKNIKTIQTQIYRAKAMLKKIYGRESG